MFKNLSNDLPAGLVVFLVAVPLCLGVALASGAPLFSGIIAGVIGGIVVGSISGSKIGVSGPAAGLAVIVFDAIRTFGATPDGGFSMEQGFPLFLAALVLAGIIQLALAFARAGIIGYFFPNSVIKGMLSAIGIIIILKQIPHALGHDVIAEGFDGFYQEDGENTFTELIVALGDINPVAVIITTLSLGILILWEQKFMKKIRIFQLIQGPLVVVALGIFLGKFLTGFDGFTLEQDEMVAIPLISEEGGFFNLFTTPNFSQVFSSTTIFAAFTIAVVASLETLLCVEATDKIDPDKNVTATNRELIAQGTGNILSGLIGGLPVTQVIVRSSANIQSGGKTKMAAIFHGVLILVSVLALPMVLNMIPLSSLAAILFLVGYKLAKPSMFKEMAAKGRQQFVPFLATILSIVFSDLLIGIGIGLAIGIIMILFKNYSTPFSFKNLDSEDTVMISLAENVTFLNKASIIQSLNVIPNNSKVVIDASKSVYIHPDVVEIIEDYIIHAKTLGISVEIKGSFEEIKQNTVALFEQDVTRGAFHKRSYLNGIWNT